MALMSNRIKARGEFMGNGDTFNIIVYDDGLPVKTLLAGLATTAGQAVQFELNDLTGTNEWPLGDGLAVMAVATSVPAGTSFTNLLASYANQFVLLGELANEVVDTHSTYPGIGGKFPPLENAQGSLILLSNDRLYADDGTAQAVACEYFEDSPAHALVQRWQVVPPPVAVDAWDIKQPVASVRPVVGYNRAIARNVVYAGSAGEKSFALQTPNNANVENPNFFHVFVACKSSAGSNSCDLMLRLGYNQLRIRRTNFYVRNTTLTRPSAPAPGDETFVIVEFKIPRNNNVNGGQTEVWQNGVLVGTVAFVMERLVPSQPSLLSMRGGGVYGEDVQMTGLVIQVGEVTEPLLSGVRDGLAHSCGLTL